MSEKEKIIGKVTQVDSTYVYIELNPDLSNLVKNSFYGVEYVGKINSFVIIKTANSKIVAQITRIQLMDEFTKQKGLQFREERKILTA